ncbi:MAG: L-histidine N(alpha)-methyltransferase [Longimicrobiales bacterium]
MAADLADSGGGGADSALLHEVAEALRSSPRCLPPKLFYDERGSRLFERITELPEYYLTRLERALLRDVAAGWVEALRPRTIVELGAGSAAKTRILLDALRAGGHAETYVPIDVSADFLKASADLLVAEFPGLEVHPIVADITRPLSFDLTLARPALFAFLGSTIGNFTDAAAGRLLGFIATHMEPVDRLLLGVDLVKDPAVLLAAYDDAAGVTAEFNRNMLNVVNRRLGGDFDVAAFDHRAVFDAEESRIEMHLVARSPQIVRIPGLAPITLAAGETIRTEISNKYDRSGIDAILASAGLVVERWENDPRAYYAILLARRQSD